MSEDTLDTLRSALIAFRDARSWKQFHTTRNLVMAMASEVGELLGTLRWIGDNDAEFLDETASNAVQDEIADITIFLVLLADKLGIDLVVNAMDKLRRNGPRFPP